jgi:hypothetical protein
MVRDEIMRKEKGRIIGKRRLIKIRETIESDDPVFREFFAIRADAEQI